VCACACMHVSAVCLQCVAVCLQCVVVIFVNTLVRASQVVLMN